MGFSSGAVLTAVEARSTAPRKVPHPPAPGPACRCRTRSSADLQATGAGEDSTVQQPITVTKNNDLSFGTVFPGVDKTIAVTAGGAAKFTVAGQASIPVNLTFSIPGTIASGGNTLTLASWSGHFATTDVTSGGTTFTPSASATTATLSGLGALYVYVGATAQPTVTQAAGSYSGSMTMTVVYF